MPPSPSAPRPTASVVVPTRDRPRYLDDALASIARQAAAAGVEMLVIDDGETNSQPATRQVAERHGALYHAHRHPAGLNAARNSAIAATSSDLLVFVDDDIRAHPGWLTALLTAAGAHPEVEVFTGPIHARIEDHRLPMCGREGPPITHMELGSHDRPVCRAWGANMAIRRSALVRVGRFDPDRELYGDEQEWQQRLLAGGGRLLYVAAAAVDHRRAGADARLRALTRAAYRRGRASRRYDLHTGKAPTLASELRVLAGCAAHGPRYRCANGLVMTAHSLGRVAVALTREGAPRGAGLTRLEAPARAGLTRLEGPARESLTRDDAPSLDDAFTSGESGTVGGRRGRARAAADVALDLGDRLAGRRARLRRAAARRPPRRRVLVLGIERPEHRDRMAAAVCELRRSRHELRVVTAPAGAAGKFENLNSLLAAHPPQEHDWLLVVDDDVELPRGFLDGFLFLIERYDLQLAQPAHRLASHAAWRVTRRRPLSIMRQTSFVEIGPVTAFAAETFSALLPFPALRMGWGLDVHWAALARERGWRLGVVDLLAIAHRAAPAGHAYSRDEALSEARAFLAGRPYVSREEAQRTLVAHRRWRRGGP